MTPPTTAVAAPGIRGLRRSCRAALLRLTLLTGLAPLASCGLLIECACEALLGIEVEVDDDDDDDNCSGRDFHHTVGARGASAPRQPGPPHPGRPVGR